MKLKTSIRPFGAEFFTGPVLNVLFALVFFFLMSSQLVLPSGIRISLPATASLFPSLNKAAIVTILCSRGDETHFFLDGREFSLADLRPKLSELSQRTKQIIIRADKKASYSTMMQVFNEALLQGYEIALASDKG